MSFTDHPLPDPLPERACESDDLMSDRVGDGREYRGHNGCCLNCDTEYSETDNSDLSNTHWMHTLKVQRAIWDRDTPESVRRLALLMDPDDPVDATEHAENLLSALGEECQECGSPISMDKAAELGFYVASDL